jgi:hypothetical protein
MRPPFSNAGDMCMGFFKDLYDAELIPEFPPHARVLELGCAEADWLRQIRESRPDLHLTGVDVRLVRRPAADRYIQGDIFQQTFDPAEFDAIVAVSVLEWAGIGHYGDPKDPDGDRRMMALARRWVKPNGWMYLDVPYNANGFIFRAAKLRAYDDAALQARLYGGEWREVARRHFNPGHQDGPYVAVVLKPC